MTESVINFDEFRERQSFIDRIRDLRGILKVRICKYTRGRTNPQLKYYFAAFVTPLSDWLRDQDENASKESAHEVLKRRFLKREVCSAETGEIITYGGSVKDLNVEEMSLYLDQCSKFLFDYCGIQVEAADKIQIR